MKSNLSLKCEHSHQPADSRERVGLDSLFPGVIVGIPGVKVQHPALKKHSPAPVSKPSSRRSKISELDPTLHCSIIGTCLTTGELRSALRKCDSAIDPAATYHELHSVAVASVGSNNETAKHIQKALDRRHQINIDRFAAARNADELRQRWNAAVQNADIPGAYWALLTHPLATDALVRHAFGDVHMLSHLVGAANRADIRKLHELEQHKAALEQTLERQQAQLRDGFTSRDAKIRELSAALSTRIEREQTGMPLAAAASDLDTLDRLVADLRKQLDLENRRHERAEKKAQDSAAAHASAETARSAIQTELSALREELTAAEAGLAALSDEADEQRSDEWALDGLSILYVGGRSHQIAQIRTVVERAGGTFVHHDGGMEERGELLPGLVGRADIAACPVDYVSHAAALMVKRLCHQADKPFLPLRSSGIASLLRALTSAECDDRHRAQHSS